MVIQENETGKCYQFQILGSGDVTGPIIDGSGPCPLTPPRDPVMTYFVEGDEGPYWFEIGPPLFKSQTDSPPLETPSFTGWTGSRDIQRALTEEGFYSGPLTGNAEDAKTQAALKAFQTANGLKPTGIFNDATSRKLAPLLLRMKD